MNKRLIGTDKEEIATVFLKKNGIQVIEKNFRYHRSGEIDIIGTDGDYLVFFEVKYRKTASAGYAAEAVDFRKILKICRVADYYIMSKGIPSDKSIRFDIIAIDGDNISWIKNAFDYAL